MTRKLMILLILVSGIVIGVALTSWRVFPTEDMIARTSCAACHDVHGAIEWEDAPFQSQVWILGDVPEATYVVVSDLFPYGKETEGTSVSLLNLLGSHGVSDFERVALESLDGGIVMLEREYVTEDSLLVPYLEGIRFKDQNQHESTWLKGVRWIVVEGVDKPLRIAGEATSFGRLLLSDRTTVIAEGGDAIYKSPLDGRIYRGDYAHTYTGVRLSELLRDHPYSGVRVVNAEGRAAEFTKDQAAGAIIATVQGRPSLVLPGLPRGVWVIDVVEITPQS